MYVVFINVSISVILKNSFIWVKCHSNMYNANTPAFNLQTKFEMFSFILSKDIAWNPICRHGSRDHAHLADSQASQAEN